MYFRVMLYRWCVAGSRVPREWLQEVGKEQGLLFCLKGQEGKNTAASGQRRGCHRMNAKKKDQIKVNGPLPVDNSFN